MDFVRDYCFVKDSKEGGEWYEKNNCRRFLYGLLWCILSPLVCAVICVVVSPLFYGFGLAVQYLMGGDITYNYLLSTLAGLIASVMLVMILGTFASLLTIVYCFLAGLVDCYGDYRRRRHYLVLPESRERQLDVLGRSMVPSGTGQ